MMKKALLAALVALAVVPATANAATYAVTETTDAKLETGATECKSTNPGQGCTLRAAVELAEHEGGEATIELPSGTYVEPSYLNIEGANVTIHGAGVDTTFVEGEHDDNLFEVESDSALTLEGVTVKDGSYEEGGAINVEPDGTLTVRHSRITENYAEVGGGIFVSEYSKALIEESSVVENAAEDFGGGVFYESGDYCDENIDNAKTGRRSAHRFARPALDSVLGTGVTIVRSSIDGNEVGGAGAGVGAEPRYGCAPVLSALKDAKSARSAARRASQQLGPEETSILIEQSAITHNEADAEAEVEYSGAGGGVYLDGEIDDPIVDTTIADNYAAHEGAGVFVAEGEEALVSDTVANNKVEPEERIEAKAHSATATVSEAFRGSNLSTSYVRDLVEEEDSYAWIYLRNTIVSEEETSEVNNCSGDIEPLIEGSGYNLDYPTTPTGGTSDSCGMSEEDKDLVGIDPKLDPKGLQENGGPTQTIALTSESPAIGYVPIAGDCEEEGIGPAIELEEGKFKPVDQRSEPRPGIAGEGCDIGAYEYQAAPAKAKEEPKPTPTPVVTPTPTPKGEVLSSKATVPAMCTSKRDITIHIQNVKQFGVVSAVVSIDGKARRTISGKHLKTGIDLVGLPKGTFTIEIVAHTRSGHTLHGQRVYHTCHTKLPGHIYLRL